MKSKLLLLSIFFSGAVFASSHMEGENMEGDNMHDDMHDQVECAEGDENCQEPGLVDHEHGEVIHDDDMELPIEDHMGDH